jgi:hypothetical protein
MNKLDERYKKELDTEAGKEKINNNSSSAKHNMAKGVSYIAITILVLFSLLYFFPNVIGFDIYSFLKGERPLGILRIILGSALLINLGVSINRIIKLNTLEGETVLTGIKNAFYDGQISRNILSIIILMTAGIVLIFWGVYGTQL